MKNLLNKMMTLGVFLVILVMSAPVVLAGHHDLATETKGEGVAFKPEGVMELPPTFLAMKDLVAQEGAIFNPMTESQLATIEGRVSLKIPSISINVGPQIQVAVLTQLNLCTFCFRTNQVTSGVIIQGWRFPF